MRNTKILYVIASLIFVTGLIVSVLILRQPNKGTVIISRDGEVLYRLNPDSYTKAETIEVTYGDEKNIIFIEKGTIRISDADCPDKTCVKMGELRSSLPIVCLPHHLVIQYANNDELLLDGTVN